ncbi:MAG: CADD family putative folate metabolism protein [Ignavibacteria bacterium]|nr:CADD family putative folate metabolism protein [Ignavibacteria bacterium]
MITKIVTKYTVNPTQTQTEIFDSAFSVSSTISSILQRHDVLRHPFFQMWNCGGLSQETLKMYSCQFYHIVKMFPRMVSAVHSNTSELCVRQALLDNLRAEEKGKEHFVELWTRFAESLGISRDELEHSQPSPKTKYFLEQMNNFCRNRSYIEGIASLYAYEAQLPGILKLKMDGLQKYYHSTEKRAIKFFTVRQEKDTCHSSIALELISKNVNAENYSKVTYAAEATAYAFWKFLDGIMEEYGKANKNSFKRL